jgi:hypothetical protein
MYNIFKKEDDPIYRNGLQQASIKYIADIEMDSSKLEDRL